MNATNLLPAVDVEPKRAPQRGSVIWLHGLGASGHDFEPIVPMLQLPAVRFVFPHAPQIPVTLNGGMVMPAWYDIRALADVPEREDMTGVARNAERVRDLIARENARGVPTDRIILAGFSQGAALALHVGLRYPETLCGMLVLSGYLMAPEQLPNESHAANATTPILMCHGARDPMVLRDWGARSRDMLAAHSPQRDLRWREFEMGHEVCPEEIQVIAHWLHERFG